MNLDTRGPALTSGLAVNISSDGVDAASLSNFRARPITLPWHAKWIGPRDPIVGAAILRSVVEIDSEPAQVDAWDSDVADAHLSRLVARSYINVARLQIVGRAEHGRDYDGGSSLLAVASIL